MPDPEFPLFRLPRPTLRHLRIPVLPNSVDFAARGRGGRSLREIPRAEHAASLRRQIATIEEGIAQIEQQRTAQQLPPQVDLILELDSAPDFPLSADQINAIATGDILLLNARPVITDDNREITRVALHVPYGGLNELAEKVRRYAEETTADGNIRHSWLANVERIAIAALEALWTDKTPLPTDNNRHWWELWVRREDSVIANFDRIARELNLRLKAPRLTLPEHVIVIAQAARTQLQNSLDLLNTLKEVRRARPYRLELSELSGPEQHDWIDEALSRMTFHPGDAVSVCVVDSGVNRAHRLLAPVFEEQDNHTVFADGDRSDSWPGAGHGTLMAGLCAYGDIRALLLSTEAWHQGHRLEGVKIIDPAQPHEPDNYGAVTRQGIALPEIAAPHRRRVYVMAVTAEGSNDGRPTAWSAAVDAAAYGAEEEQTPKRVILLSAGNVDVFGLGTGFEYVRANDDAAVQDPAQAWNAVTVGAITHRTEITENDAESALTQPIATDGNISPYSTTTNEWETHWPIKPEIVMEGGNAALHPDNGPERRDSLDLLSTSAEIQQRPISVFRATSPATALAARLAAELTVLYPDCWPESIRGLLVHSGRWNSAMLGGIDPFKAYTRAERDRFVAMLRRFGFGEADIARAKFSSEQSVTLLREDTITPYKGTAGSASLNQCHIHRIRLPADLLREHGETTCTMRVTLSYFTAPNPSASNRIPGSRYRYGGALLRFRVRHKDESEETFERKLAGEAAEPDDHGEDTENLYDQAWALGAKLRGKAGSLVQDVWQGSAADLAQMDRIGVFPAKGWWAARSFAAGSPWHRCHLKSMRYSLIVSIEISADVPLYTAIRTLIEVPLSIEA